MVVALPQELKSHQISVPTPPAGFTLILKSDLPVRPMSARDVADSILKELQEIGGQPNIAEESLYARILNDGSKKLAQMARLTVNGEWKVAGNLTPEEACSQVASLFLRGFIGNAAGEFVADLSRAQSEDDAIELVYDRMHDLIDRRQFDVIDQVLSKLNVDDLANSVLLSVLTITALSEVQKNLASRNEFFMLTKTCLVLREGESTAQELLVGLE